MTITCICFLVRTARFEPAAYGSEALRRINVGVNIDFGMEWRKPNSASGGKMTHDIKHYLTFLIHLAADL